VIRSPLDGLLTRRILSPGEFAHQEAVIVAIADLDPLNIEVFLPVVYYPQLATGQVGTVRPAEYLWCASVN
jgi:hypothetical protein